MSAKPVIECIQLSKSYQQGGISVTALKDFSMLANRGELLGVVGPSGSGKSTLLSILGLMEPPSSGTLILDQIRVPFESGESGLAPLRRAMIGFVFQHFNLISSLTVRENVELPLLLNACHKDEARIRALGLLERVGLAGKVERLPNQLSGGEMQRVAVCRAIAHEPQIILADEPTGSLDSVSGQEVMELLREVSKEQRCVIMATHSERAMRYCSRIIRLEDGRLRS